MKTPKTTRVLCPKCKKHTTHQIKVVKKRARSSKHPMSISQRHFKEIMKGYGGFPRPNPKGEGKATKKIDLRFLCSECKKMNIRGKGFRVKKFEFE